MVNLTVGLVVNPYAGIGGEVGLKGSDGASARVKALDYKSELYAPMRVKQMIDQLGEMITQIKWITADGVMGSDYLPVKAKTVPVNVPSTQDDTKWVLECFLAEQVDLIVFAGGDGTARDVFDVIDHQIPCLGLPSGVKMQSGVFAISPIMAAELIKGLVETKLVRSALQDVRDIDEEKLRESKVQSKYYGSLLVPDSPQYLQNLKQGGVESEPLVVDEMAAFIEEQLDEIDLLLVGPGRTTADIMACLGFDNTLVGFDAVIQGESIQSDLTGDAILQLTEKYPNFRILLSPTGNQGFLLGRGNQQLNPLLSKHPDKDCIMVLATRTKLNSLKQQPLWVDVGLTASNQKLSGLYSVLTGYDNFVLYPVRSVDE